MSIRRGEATINTLEQRFRHLAIPNLLRWLAILQVLSWGLSLFSPTFIEWLTFDRELILAGQAWRFISWIFIPVSDFVLWVLIAAMFMFFISDSIENAWGAFRVNLYVLSGLFMVAALGLLLPDFPFKTSIMRTASFSSSFLAFCALFPNQVINLMMVIPVKAKWLGWANLALLIANITMSPTPGFAGITALVATLPFCLVFLPGFAADMKQSSEAAVRRHKFQSDVSAGGGETFHLCSQCSATEVSNPEKEFRVTSEGEEICLECLEKKRV